MFEPEWEPVCECRYDAENDRMDRDDCVLHRHEEDEAISADPEVVQKKPPSSEKRNREDAA
jgi:hypothetical protein